LDHETLFERRQLAPYMAAGNRAASGSSPASGGGCQADGGNTWDLQGTYWIAAHALLFALMLPLLLLRALPPLPLEPTAPPPPLPLIVNVFLEQPIRPWRHTPTSLSLPPVISARCMSACARNRLASDLLSPLSPMSCCSRQLEHLSFARADAVPSDDATAEDAPHGHVAV
jgi:hypothetical protein